MLGGTVKLWLISHAMGTCSNLIYKEDNPSRKWTHKSSISWVICEESGEFFIFILTLRDYWNVLKIRYCCRLWRSSNILYNFWRILLCHYLAIWFIDVIDVTSVHCLSRKCVQKKHLCTIGFSGWIQLLVCLTYNMNSESKDEKTEFL